MDPGQDSGRMRVRRVVHVPRLVTHTFEAEQESPTRPLGTGAVRILVSFMAVLLVGTLLLMLPFANAEGDVTSFETALFTAVSAICVTGLNVVDTQAHYTFFGEAVILGLIQIGGLGYMLGIATVLWVFGRQIGLRDRHLLRQYYGSPTMGEALSFAKRIAIFAIAVEIVGAIVLYVVFLVAGVSATTGIWWSLFHSISAFNNAGFNLTGADMVPFQTDPLVLLSLASLIILGSIGALPILFLLREKRERMPLDYILVFLMTGGLLFGGTIALLATEWSNPETFGAVEPIHRFVLAFFQATTPRTAGFSAVDMGAMRDESLFLNVALMFIGGAAGSTAGGVKVGTFALLFVALLATLHSEERAVAFRREIPSLVMRQALTIALLAVAAVFATTISLLVFSAEEFLPLLFEAVSALATVGLSTGITPDHSSAARFVLIAAMLLGRFGPLIVILAMTRQRQRRIIYELPQHSIRLG